MPTSRPSHHDATRSWQGDGLTIDTRFPGGNLLVDGMADGVLRVRQDQRDTSQPWFHWYFRIGGAAGRRIEVRFGAGRVVGVRGPAISLDEGRNWRWLDADAAGHRDTFTYDVPAGADSVHFSMGIPHQTADWQTFAAQGAGLRSDILCQSRSGRPVPLARIGGGDAPWLLLVTARHHSCEAMAGWVLEGLAGAIAADPAWHQLAETVLVPFVDLDGVEDGDQGKGRHPRDHGRDYLGESIYPETAAIRAGLPAWAGDRRIVVIDLHCPWIAGDHNQCIYQVGLPGAAAWERQQRLGRLLEELCTGPLPYRCACDLPFGTDWNAEANFRDGLPLAHWALARPGTAFATTIEIPYADADDFAVLPDGARAFGADLAGALARLLRAWRE